MEHLDLEENGLPQIQLMGIAKHIPLTHVKKCMDNKIASPSFSQNT
jgi:hypothetical protein